MRGNRSLTLAHVQNSQFRVENGRGVSRKELQQVAREAAQALDLSVSVRSVLNELVAVWGEIDFNGKLIVWPSNNYLCDKTGLSERTLRYCINALVQLGLIAPKDSANGKRFSIRNKTGSLIDAFGFDLAPLYRRRDAFLAALTERDAIRASLKRCFDRVTICRRFVAEALETHRIKFGSTFIGRVTQDMLDLLKSTPRRSLNAPLALLESLSERWLRLRQVIEDELLKAGNGGKDCRQIETDNGPESTCNKVSEDDLEKSLPSVEAYFGSKVRTESDIRTAAEYLRPTLGAHKSAWNEAVEALGLTKASIVLLWVFQVYDDDQAAGRKQIVNPGGYFRAMSRLVAERKINLSHELHQLAIKRLAQHKEEPAIHTRNSPNFVGENIIP